MSYKNLFILLITGQLLLSSCSKKIIPDKPFLANTNFRLDSLPVSEINVPIQVNLKPVYGMAEKNVDTLFTSTNYPDDWVQSGCDTRYKYIFRRSPLFVKASGTALLLGFTGFYKIIGSTRVCVNNTAISPWTPPCRCGFSEPERRVNVLFSNNFALQPNYKLKLTIKRSEPEALDKCEVCFWGQDITKQVINGLKSELDLSKSEIEKNYGLVDLKPKFQQVWDQLNKVYNLYGFGWLQINPRNIRINSIYARNDSLNVNIGMVAQPVISFEKPREQTSSIPDISLAGSKPGFSIFMDAVLNYDSLSQLMNRQLAGKEFDMNKGPVKKKFIINECRLYGSGNEKLIIKIGFGGTDNGILYLTGKPVYDPSKKLLEVVNVEFDIKSKDAILKAADWLFNRRILNEVQQYAKYDLKSFIDTATITISQQLNREWIKGVRSSGQVNDLRLTGIYPMDQHLVIRSSCSGSMSVKIESIDFSL